MSPEKPRSTSIHLLHTIAVVVLLAGAVGSLGLTLYTGRRNASVLLLVLFAGWVFSPFMALVVANIVSKPWSSLARVTLYWLMLVITVGSLLAYSGVLSPPDAKPAFIFLVVPLLSWLLMAIVIPMARYRSRKSDGA
jgi:hypothetical protein